MVTEEVNSDSVDVPSSSSEIPLTLSTYLLNPLSVFLNNKLVLAK
jgi:hypothetical protein